LEEYCYELLNRLHRLTKTDNLCIAGGVALHCSMNGKLREHTPFHNIFVMPAAHDAGLSMGAALWASRTLEAGFRRAEIDHAYLGSDHGIDDIEAEIRKLPATVAVDKPLDLVNVVADLLCLSSLFAPLGLADVDYRKSKIKESIVRRQDALQARETSAPIDIDPEQGARIRNKLENPRSLFHKLCGRQGDTEGHAGSEKVV